MPVGPYKNFSGILAPNVGNITPEDWRRDAALCPPNWRADHNLLRNWSLFQFAATKNAEVSRRCTFEVIELFFVRWPLILWNTVLLIWILLADQRGIEPPPAICLQHQERRDNNWTTEKIIFEVIEVDLIRIFLEDFLCSTPIISVTGRPSATHSFPSGPLKKTH